MAFEVARVHGIISSNIREDGSSMLSSIPGSVVVVREEALSRAQTQPTGSHLSSLPSDLHLCGSAAWPDVAGSPLGSSPRSAETEDDEDDEVLEGLADCIAQIMLSEDESSIVQQPRGVGGKTHSEAPIVSDIETIKASGSPPSSWSSGSLSLGQWQSSSTASSKGSSQVSSQVSSPPTTPSQAQQSDAWDLLYAAAGEVIRLKMYQQKKSTSVPPNRYHNQRVHSQPLQAHGEVPAKIGVAGGMGPRYPPSRVAGSLLSPPSLPYLRNRNETTAMNGSANEQRWNSTTRGEDRRVCSSHQMAAETGLGAGSGCQSRVYPVHHQQPQGCRPGLQKGYHGQYQPERCNDYNTPQWTGANRGGGSGMRAVFLGSGRESSGTGVFIPRSAGNGPELKRKPTCSSVLLPSRIVQMLNLNVENICSHPATPSSLVNPASCPDHKTSMHAWPTMSHSLISPAMGHPKPSFEESWLASCGKACPSILQQTTAPELSLPSEWTY